VLQDTIFQDEVFRQFPDDKIQSLVTAKEGMDAQVQLRGDTIARANGEKAVLEKIIGKVTAQAVGQAAELSPDKWTQMINLYRDRLAALDLEIRGAEREIRDLSLELRKNAQELAQLQGGGQKKRNQAVVILSLSEASKVTLTLSYIVYGPRGSRPTISASIPRPRPWSSPTTPMSSRTPARTGPAWSWPCRRPGPR